MKSKLFKMKKLLLFPLLLVAFACSKEDESSEQSEQTFLEKYDGTSWRDDYNDSFEILTLIDGTYFYNYVDLYKGDNPECYKIKSGAQIYDGQQIEATILKNEPNEMILEVKYDGVASSRISLTINGETLTERVTYFDENGSEDETYTYTKTSASYSDYCN
tara:strand:- start:522 stop:1004 length:483 start_codon:yes stop_codon:yes gene_type:complete